MKVKHTPGPWELRGEGGYANLGGIRVGSPDGYILAVAIGDVPELDAGANASLIAAAPDLLRELQHLVGLLEPLEIDGSLNVPGLATLNGARAAIAGATDA